MGFEKFNLEVLEEIIDTQYGDFGGLVKVDKSDSFDFYKLCEQKGISMEKYFLLGVHFGTSSITNVSSHDSIYCFVLVLETKKYGSSFDEISKKLQSTDDKTDIKSFHFKVSYNELAKCIKRFSIGFVSPLSKYINEFKIKEIQ